MRAFLLFVVCLFVLCEVQEVERRTCTTFWNERVGQAVQDGRDSGPGAGVRSCNWLEVHPRICATPTSETSSSEPDDVLRQLRCSWHEFWLGWSVTSIPELSALPPTAEIRTAASSFKAGHVGHQWVPSQPLPVAVGRSARRIDCAAEALGDTLCAQRSLIVATLSKPTGGFRPAGLQRRHLSMYGPWRVVTTSRRGKTAGVIIQPLRARAEGRRCTRSGARPSWQSTLPATRMQRHASPVPSEVLRDGRSRGIVDPGQHTAIPAEHSSEAKRSRTLCSRSGHRLQGARFATPPSSTGCWWKTSRWRSRATERW